MHGALAFLPTSDSVPVRSAPSKIYAFIGTLPERPALVRKDTARSIYTGVSRRGENYMCSMVVDGPSHEQALPNMGGEGAADGSKQSSRCPTGDLVGNEIGHQWGRVGFFGVDHCGRGAKQLEKPAPFPCSSHHVPATESENRRNSDNNRGAAVIGNLTKNYPDAR